MAVRCVVFNQTMSGPPAGLDGTLAALRNAGFEAHAIDCPYGDDSPAGEGESESDRTARIRVEQAEAWLSAEVVMRDQPSYDDQVALMQRAADATARNGFELRLHGAGWTWRDSIGGV